MQHKGEYYSLTVEGLLKTVASLQSLRKSTAGTIFKKIQKIMTMSTRNRDDDYSMMKKSRTMEETEGEEEESDDVVVVVVSDWRHTTSALG